MERRSRGRGFKSTLLHHPVSRFADIADNRSKSARVRAISDDARTQRISAPANIARIWRILSPRDLPRSADHRHSFACIPRLVTRRRSRSRLFRLTRSVSRIGQNLSRCDFARSADLRSRFAESRNGRLPRCKYSLGRVAPVCPREPREISGSPGFCHGRGQPRVAPVVARIPRFWQNLSRCDLLRSADHPY